MNLLKGFMQEEKKSKNRITKLFLWLEDPALWL